LIHFAVFMLLLMPDHLGLVAELDRFVDAALGDRPGIRVVQADQPGGRGGHVTGEAAVGLRDDAASAFDQDGRLADGSA
jgi:hypothetical protein